MFSLNLISRDKEQKNWALCPFDAAPPTISEFKRNPHLYNNLAHGVYELQFGLDHFKEYSDGDIRVYKEAFGNMRSRRQENLTFTKSSMALIQAYALGNVRYNKDILSVTGRFEKKGSSIIFVPLTEEE